MVVYIRKQSCYLLMNCLLKFLFIISIYSSWMTVTTVLLSAVSEGQVKKMHLLNVVRKKGIKFIICIYFGRKL